MRSLQNNEARNEICGRLERLTPDCERQWGSLDHGQVLTHMGDALRLALQDIPISSPSGVLQFALLRHLIIHRLPWPKGPQGPKEAFTSLPTAFEEDKKRLLDLIHRFGTATREDVAPLHPIFGRMTLKDWDVLMYRHADHHLRQFSV